MKDVIEEGLRRARKYSGSFTVITQSILDIEQFGSVGNVIMSNTDFKFYLQSPDFAQAREKKFIQCGEFTLRLMDSVKTNKPKYSENRTWRRHTATAWSGSSWTHGATTSTPRRETKSLKSNSSSPKTAGIMRSPSRKWSENTEAEEPLMNQSDDAYLRKLLETYRALLDPGIDLFEAEDVTVDSSGSRCTR